MPNETTKRQPVAPETYLIPPSTKELPHKTRANRAEWWYAAMHRAVDAARDWKPSKEAKFQLPTKEQLAEDDAMMERHSLNCTKARLAIVKYIKPWKEGCSSSAGEIACPICEKGRLSFSRASSNGHIWARCSTEGCVAWQE